ncbi:MAG: transcriptional regulator [Elusimicrobia bacterium RIFOXYD2_FULL_34_15]|nr:MAG: transcriptional regulator [Elusimicrobia bacterium RIFOXYD2_FULL_34_15]
MKKIESYIQPFMLQKVIDGLHEIHIHGMTVSEVKGFGKEKDESYPHHSGDYVVEFTPKVKIEIICRNKDTDEIIEVIKKTAHTGRQGDGKIIVYNSIEKVVSIRTSEEGEKAI